MLFVTCVQRRREHVQRKQNVNKCLKTSVLVCVCIRRKKENFMQNTLGDLKIEFCAAGGRVVLVFESAPNGDDHNFPMNQSVFLGATAANRLLSATNNTAVCL